MRNTRSRAEQVELLGRSSAVQVDGAQMAREPSARANPSNAQFESNRDVERPPAQGVFGDIAFLAAAASRAAAQAQANFDRPGGDYYSSPVASGDPADCALVCERDRRCRAWSFNYPTEIASGAVCWLKSNVPARIQNNCCVSGVRGAGVVEPRNGAIETSIDRFGGDYRNFD